MVVISLWCGMRMPSFKDAVNTTMIRGPPMAPGVKDAGYSAGIFIR